MNLFDASILDSSAATYGTESYVNEIYRKVSLILQKRFQSYPQKQRIITTSEGFNFACPYCGDSATIMSKKRGHIILNGKWSGNYKCFNCSRFVPITKFMQDFNEDLSLAGIKYSQEHKTEIETTNKTKSGLDLFNKEIALQYGIERHIFKDLAGLRECDGKDWYGKTAHDYLVSRYQFSFNKFLYSQSNNAIVILNLVDDKVIGCQMRFLNPNIPKDKRFRTLTLSKIYKNILKSENVNIPEQLESLSTLFDLFNVSLYQPIIVTEGPMDAFLLPNAIATSGANKKIPISMSSLYYMYDSDATGKKQAIAAINKKFNIFLWGKLKKDLNLPKQNKWDVNDIIKYMVSKYGYNNFKIDWIKYFSNNPLDLIYLDDLGMSI